jgi:hypothetical protein
MEKKHALAGLAVVAVLGALAFPWAQWGLFALKSRGTIEKLGRFPGAPEILALPDALKQDAAKYRIDPAKLQVRMGLEERAMMGAVAFTYLTVDVTDGKRSLSYSVGSERGHRIETAHTGEFLEALQEGGVDTSKLR